MRWFWVGARRSWWGYGGVVVNVGGESFRVGSGTDRGFSGNRGSSPSQLQFEWCFHELGDGRSEPCEIADVPRQQSICSRFQGAMSNECIIGGCTDDGPRGS